MWPTSDAVKVTLVPVTFFEYWPEVVPYWTVGVPAEAVCHWTTISLQKQPHKVTT